MDGQTDILRQHSLRYVYASRGKNVINAREKNMVVCVAQW